jgi:hypothetical protein
MNNNNKLDQSHELCAHTQCRTLPALFAQITYENHALKALFSLEHQESITIPKPEISRPRKDQLWQQTCFELFLGYQDHYLEYNLSPSGAWQCYQFSDYRLPSPPQHADVEIPSMELSASGYAFEINCSQPNDINLAAILIDKAQNTAFYSIKHVTGKPDFHHRQNFVTL